MGEGFIRLKKINFIDALVKALLAFVSVTLLVVATFLIVIHQSNSDFKVLFAILIGVASGLLLGFLTFFIFRLSDKRLAERLDRGLGLKEKVQTMYAFRNEEGGLKDLQREDAQALLSKQDVSIGKLFKRWIAFIIAFVVAVAYFSAAMVLFLKEEHVTPPDNIVDDPNENVPPVVEEFEPTDHQKKALEELVAYVEASLLQSDAKVQVVAILRELLDNMDTLGTDTEMRDYVVNVIKQVRGIVNAVNTTFAFRMSSGNSKNDNMKAFSFALYSLDLNMIESEVENLTTALFDGTSRDEIASFKDELGAVLNSEQFKDKGELFELIKGLYNTLADISDHPDYSDANVIRKLKDALTGTLMTGLKQLIPLQKNNEDVKVYVVEELMRIFGITEMDLQERKDEEGSLETEEPEERPEEGDDGGFGLGDTLFGSNDLVIDPTKDPGNDVDSIWVEYGDIIFKNGYDQKLTDLLVNGELSEELKQLLEKYFEILETPGDK